MPGLSLEGPILLASGHIPPAMIQTIAARHVSDESRRAGVNHPDGAATQRVIRRMQAY
jgi:hypothetical protein